MNSLELFKDIDINVTDISMAHKLMKSLALALRLVTG